MSIAQHFRKHKLNLFPSDPERSQMSLREDYERILKSIQVLAGEKEQEMNKYADFSSWRSFRECLFFKIYISLTISFAT